VYISGMGKIIRDCLGAQVGDGALSLSDGRAYCVEVNYITACTYNVLYS
jgi:hypothetical protein